ncbi:MAG: hypothetical protein KDD56_06715 [Bdellovibrionales bacterium]|nr:hypothetical protein [Bdellovibrionales bacterium]
MIVFGVLGSVTSFLLFQKSMVVRALDHTAEGLGGELLKQLETLKQNNGGNIPANTDIAPYLSQSLPKANEILLANYADSRYFTDPVPSISEENVATGVWDVANSPACQPNCFAVSSDASQVNSLKVKLSATISAKNMFGSTFFRGITFDIHRYVIVYFDINIGGATVVERN